MCNHDNIHQKEQIFHYNLFALLDSFLSLFEETSQNYFSTERAGALKNTTLFRAGLVTAGRHTCDGRRRMSHTVNRKALFVMLFPANGRSKDVRNGICLCHAEHSLAPQTANTWGHTRGSEEHLAHLLSNQCQKWLHLIHLQVPV